MLDKINDSQDNWSAYLFNNYALVWNSTFIPKRLQNDSLVAKYFKGREEAMKGRNMGLMLLWYDTYIVQ